MSRINKDHTPTSSVSVLTGGKDVKESNRERYILYLKWKCR